MSNYGPRAYDIVGTEFCSQKEVILWDVAVVVVVDFLSFFSSSSLSYSFSLLKKKLLPLADEKSVRASMDRQNHSEKAGDYFPAFYIRGKLLLKFAHHMSCLINIIYSEEASRDIAYLIYLFRPGVMPGLLSSGLR
jgi:hypothetical protein